MFVATDTARDAARQMARGEIKAASVAWATADEVAAAGVAARVRALRERVTQLQAGTAQALRDHREQAGQRRAAGDAPSLQRRFRHGRVVGLLHSALEASARLMERHDAAFERMAALVALLPQTLKLVTDRAAERALQAKIKAGMAGVRERHAQHLRQQAEAARDGQARVVVETWAPS